MKNHIRNCLSGLSPRLLTKGFIREAAVLVPVLELEEEYHFLLTRRTETVQTHKGQVSFPGGMREGEEELLQTAIRETYEEVGIPEKNIEILGRFHDYISITHYRVTPFVAFLHAPFTIRPQASEVAEVLQVPFETFLDPSLLRIGRTEFEQRDVNVYYYSYGANQIWGLTARIIKEFLESLKLHP
jgi:8-oxo-dGTP pyrophosphatase MutT (NUDIX family)